MPINKVDYYGRVLIDLTSDTVSPETLLKGYTAHDKSGNSIVGTFEGGTYEDGDNLAYGPNYYIVTFETNGGNTIDSLLVEEGSTIELPEPSKSGYGFEGWYTDEEFASEFNSSTPINQNITLYAKWEESITSGYNISLSAMPMLNPSTCFYSLDNGTTWNDFYNLSPFTNPILTGVTQIKFKGTTDEPSTAFITSNTLGLNIAASMETVISNNYTLTQDITDLYIATM